LKTEFPMDEIIVLKEGTFVNHSEEIIRLSMESISILTLGDKYVRCFFKLPAYAILKEEESYI